MQATLIEQTKMKTNLLKRNNNFWIYHLTTVVLLSAYQVVLSVSFYTGDELYYSLSECFLNVIVFTFVALYFRKTYARKGWKNYSIPKITLIGVIFSCVAALIGRAIIQFIQVLIFWAHFTSPDFIKSFLSDPLKNTFDMYFSNAVTFAIYTCLWIFMYISITTIRNARESELANLRLNSSLKEAQLNSLSNQLNPHFLFNALNNIRFMMHENSKHADKMITSLSDILRYSLESNKKEKVSLYQEIEIVDRYIDIVKTQLENRLIFIMEIPDSLRNHLIPPMTLQILVENAVKHGLDNIQNGGMLSVMAACKGDGLFLSVANDLPKTIKNQNDGIGLGLQNIRQRLKLLYGDQASFTQTTSDTQFVVDILIPKETEQ